jgi:DNA segregation ATPase FtsK/SpoIIIE, S-DNA-T family
VLVDDAGRTDDDGSLAAVSGATRPGLHVIAAGRPDDFRTPSSWTRALRRSRTGVLLRPDLATDGDVFTARLPRRVPVALVAGRGFVVRGGEPTLAQLATAEPVAGLGTATQ